MENKNIIKTMEGLFKTLEKNTEVIIIKCNNKQIKVPIRLTAKAFEEYFNTYDETEDYRKAFCVLIFYMIDCAKTWLYKNYDYTINLNDVELLNDNDLYLIMSKIIENKEGLKEIIGDDFKYNFKKFYSIFIELKKKYDFEKVNFSKPLKDAIALQNKIKYAIKPSMMKQLHLPIKDVLPLISHATKYQNLYNTIDKMQKLNNIEPNKTFNIDNLSKLESPTKIICNKLEELSKKQDANIEYQSEQIKLLAQMIDLNEEEQKNRKLGDKLNQKMIIFTVITVILSMLLTIITGWEQITKFINLMIEW